MSSVQKNSVPRQKQAKFQIEIIWVALAIAIFGGFALALHLSFLIGFNLSLGKGFAGLIQTHGHLQLIGWAGLFIIGISLHFIPRLSSVPISEFKPIKQILWLIGVGLLLRLVSHTVLPYLEGHVLFVPIDWLVATSGLIEWYGILIYLSLLIGTIWGIDDTSKRPGLLSIRPFFGMMVVGFFLYATVNMVLLIQMALNKNVVVNQGWNEFAIGVFTGMVLLPVAFAFSIRMFPLYLRLPAADWGVHRVAYLYLIGFGLQILTSIPLNLGRVTHYLSDAGMLVRGSVILYVVWKLDVLTRGQEPWTVHRELQPSPDRRPTRPNIPDYGEFGRFERLVYAAYAWLVLGALAEMLIGGFGLFRYPLSIGSDAVRHIYLLGFITNLILGMAVRMIPGFIGKRQIASTKLVDATFWLANTAAVGRVLILLLPSGVFEVIPAIVVVVETAFGLSGILGLGAVVCLAVNLWKTAHVNHPKFS